jgi:hypothetical protein
MTVRQRAGFPTGKHNGKWKNYLWGGIRLDRLKLDRRGRRFMTGDLVTRLPGAVLKIFGFDMETSVGSVSTAVQIIIKASRVTSIQIYI